MLKISFAADFDRFRLGLTDFQRKQLPIAAAKSLTRLAELGRDEAKDRMRSVFDRPTPFSANQGVTITSARKTNLESTVFVKDRQARYLHLQEHGGLNEPKKKALVTPAIIRLNQYGNIPNKAIARLKAKPNVFVGTVNGIGGFWQRPSRDGRAGLTLLARFDGPKAVEPHPFFYPAIDDVLRRRFSRLLSDALGEALETAFA